MDFELWTLLVEYMGGGFWIAVFLVALFIFFILAVFGKVSKLTVIYYELLFLMTMTVGFGYKWISALCMVAIIIWLYFQWNNYSR